MTRIDCSDFLNEIGNLLDGEVDPQWKAHLEAHLAECKACSVVYDSTRKTITFLTDSDSFELSVDELKSGAADIMAKIRATR